MNRRHRGIGTSTVEFAPAEDGDRRALLIYDGDCGFCSSAAAWITARWGSSPTAVAVASQSLDDGELRALQLSRDAVNKAAWWVSAGKRSRGHLAIARALIAVGGGWGLAGRALLVPPARQIAAVGYRVVARYRSALPGGTPSCRS